MVWRLYFRSATQYVPGLLNLTSGGTGIIDRTNAEMGRDKFCRKIHLLNEKGVADLVCRSLRHYVRHRYVTGDGSLRKSKRPSFLHNAVALFRYGRYGEREFLQIRRSIRRFLAFEGFSLRDGCCEREFVG